MREEILAALDTGDHQGAISGLRALVRSDRSRRTLAFVERALDRLSECTYLAPVTVYVLRSVTLEPLVPHLRAAGLQFGLNIRLCFGAFNQFEQELAGFGELPVENPTAVLFLARLEELAPDLAERFAGISVDRREVLGNEVVDRVSAWLDQAAMRWPRARRMLCNLAQPLVPAFGLADPGRLGQRRAICGINARFEDACSARHGAYLFDLDALLAQVGRGRVFDALLMATARAPYTVEAFDALGVGLARVLSAAVTPRRKCVVLDCDQTLWGGIVGEDGLDGISLGPEHPGSAWVAFQQRLLRLVDCGIILALNSKNNEEDVLRVLREHPSQVLREHHFAAWRVNWQDKATNLSELAAEINIGLDAMVFIDDSDVECSWVAAQHPQVQVVQAPRDPLLLVKLVDEIHSLDSLGVSEEDLGRSQMYQAEAARRREQGQSRSIDEFLASLEMRMAVRPTRYASITRVAQLTQKTNQFNLTTRRYSEADIQAFLDNELTDVFDLHLADRYGEYGLTGVLITRLIGAELWVDTLLLSCRVLGRQVEDVVLAFLVRHGQRRGASRIIGEYVPTPKNQQTADLWSRFGFREFERKERSIRFERLLATPPPDWPRFITLDLADLETSP